MGNDATAATSTPAGQLDSYVGRCTGHTHHFTGERRILSAEWTCVRSVSIATGSTMGGSIVTQKLSDPRKQPTAETLPMLRALPTDWSAPHQRPELGQAIAALQALTAGGSTQLQQEPMDISGSVVAASEAGASEMPSE